MGQEIIDIRDIKGGNELVDNTILNTTLSNYITKSEIPNFDDIGVISTVEIDNLF